MLFGQKSRRTENRHLFAAHHGHEGGAKGHFGFAKAHVAADETVHGTARRHVFEDGLDRRRLIGRFVKGETFGKRFVVGGRHLEGEARAALPHRVEMKKLRRRVADLFRGLFLRFFPVAAPERMQGGVLRIGPAVSGDEVQIRNGNEELRVVLVFETKEFGFAFVRRHLLETEIAPDPVLEVHDRIAHLEFRDVANEHLDVCRLRSTAKPRAAGTRRIEFRFGEKRDLRVFDARPLVERSRREPHGSVGREKVVERLEFGEVESGRAKEVRHRPLTADGRGKQQNAFTAHAARFREVEKRLRGVLALSVDRDALKILRRTLLDAADRKACEGRERREEVFGGEPQLLGFECGTKGIGRENAGALRRFAKEAFEGLLNVAYEHHARLGREVVGKRRRFVKKERLIVFDPRREDAVSRVLVGEEFAWIAGEAHAPALTEGREGLFVHREFMTRQKADFVHFFHRALRLDVEPADRFDFVVEEVETEGTVRPHGKDVDDLAAYGEFARRQDFLHVGVARLDEIRLQRRETHRVARTEEEGVPAHERHRREALRRGDGGNEHDVPFGAFGGKPIERRQAFGDEVFLRTQNVVREGFPVGEARDGEVRREPADFLRKTIDVRRIGADHDKALSLCLGFEPRLGERQGVACERRERERVAVARLKGKGTFGEKRRNRIKSHGVGQRQVEEKT